MEADLERYLDDGVGRVQDGIGACPFHSYIRKRFRIVARESDALLSDLMVDQPLLWLSIAFSIGLFLGRTLFSRK